MATSSDRQTAFKREVASRFGLVPNFFSSAPDAPELVAKLWDFAKAGYLDNPLPSLFKERLFVYLSRFCEVRYLHRAALRVPAGARPRCWRSVRHSDVRPGDQAPEILTALAARPRRRFQSAGGAFGCQGLARTRNRGGGLGHRRRYSHIRGAGAFGAGPKRFISGSGREPLRASAGLAHLHPHRPLLDSPAS
jgi:hypothetical protein